MNKTKNILIAFMNGNLYISPSLSIRNPEYMKAIEIMPTTAEKLYMKLNDEDKKYLAQYHDAQESPIDAFVAFHTVTETAAPTLEQEDSK